jgi:signal transduction histidine kinase
MKLNVMYPQTLEVTELIREATDLFRLQAHLKEINVDVNVEHPININADKEMISLVIRNLLTNAIKFTPPKGNITVGVHENDSDVEIFVKDTGVGMEPKVMDHLFGNSYYSTKGTNNETGTGLGLMLCKDFITMNGGNIHVSSEPGKGSTFSFTLPRNVVSK